MMRYVWCGEIYVVWHDMCGVVRYVWCGEILCGVVRYVLCGEICAVW